jgi:hypothetical protein
MTKEKTKANFAWLSKAQRQLNKDSAFRKLGSTDVKLGFLVGEVAHLVTFEAFEISSIRAMDPNDVRDADLVINMSPRAWNAYLRQRKAGKAPSLMSVDVDTPIVYAQNPLKRLLFERYNLSIQAFVDRGAKLAA